tara:strand:+ start:66074 stop:66475 length:402 start_codon:yes stop_codon:yes gene_type:complete
MHHILTNATELLLLLFLIITFLQSGLDKLMDWKGNLAWLKGHFAKSPLRDMVPVLLGIVLIMEMLVSIFCVVGLYLFLEHGKNDMALYGGMLACVCLLMLLFGQRMAKDYEGAKTIAIYFVPAILLVFLLQEG